MLRDYHQSADEASILRLANEAKWDEAFEALAEPLHQTLYAAGSFDILDRLSITEKLILSMAYVSGQVANGGFIQLFQNGYAPLLVTAIESAQGLSIGSPLVTVMDDALKVYVLNYETLSRETSVEEFGKLYEEFREFEPLDEAFYRHQPQVIEAIVRLVTDNDTTTSNDIV